MNRISPSTTIWLTLMALLSGCSRPETVVVYTSVDQVFAEAICDDFERETGIRVELVPDTEETKGTGLHNRLIEEKNRPRADVFWSGDPVRAASLKADGVSAAYKSPAAEGLPEALSDADGHWTCFSARARVIIYNTDQVPEDRKPTSILDLADKRFKGRACIANPLFGTTSMHAAALFSVWGEEKATAFFQSLVDNDVAILGSNGDVKAAVAAGDFDIGLTDTDDVHVAMQDGKHVDFVYADADGAGTLVMPNAVVLIAGGPHPETARKFIDYLLRRETEEALARGEAAQMPLRAGAALPDGFRFKRVSEIHAMPVDYAELAIVQKKLLGDFLKQWVDEHK
ncbi:MAG: extracellular solute-binding protein [Planctomycetes bacterium]|nr:extracellular solute-binding protein [Planctomycetota bacterium]